MVRPLRIGLSASFFHADPNRNLFKGKTLLYLEESMAHYVMAQGALALLLPTATMQVQVADLMADIDGLLLTGGADVCPETYHETALNPLWTGDYMRDQYEIGLLRAAMRARVPVFGICRGAQIINVGLGGTLYQDTFTQREGAKQHRDAEMYDKLNHEVRLMGILQSLYRADRGRVNSVHHQAIKDLAEGLVVEALSEEDDVIEAVRWTGLVADGSAESPTYVSGVQWHPEFLQDGQTGFLDRTVVLNDFLKAARLKAQES